MNAPQLWMNDDYLERADDMSAAIIVRHPEEGSRPFALSTASANRFSDDQTWVLARVLVDRSVRRQGHGRRMLERLCALLKAQGVRDLLVSPGGYDTPEEVQFAFYRACGFEPYDEHPGILRRRLWGARFYTVYYRPTDYPNSWVLRGITVEAGHTTHDASPTAIVTAGLDHEQELAALRASLPAGLSCCPRLPEDEPQIVEMWF